MGLLQEAAHAAERYQDFHLTMDFHERTVLLDGRPVVLPKREFELLSFLVRHADRAVPRAVLMTFVWGYSLEAQTRTIDVHIRRLRSHLGHFGEHYIETIFKVGYRFRPLHERLPEGSNLIVMGAGSAGGGWQWNLRQS